MRREGRRGRRWNRWRRSRRGSAGRRTATAEVMIYFEMSVSGERLKRRHIASLTAGQMVMLNL
jgi:hypothetical protein